MAIRMQVTLDRDQHERARKKALGLGISLAQYIRGLVARDLEDAAEVEGDISEIFGIGDSGGSDVARHKQRYLGEATAEPAKTARLVG